MLVILISDDADLVSLVDACCSEISGFSCKQIVHIGDFKRELRACEEQLFLIDTAFIDSTPIELTLAIRKKGGGEHKRVGVLCRHQSDFLSHAFLKETGMINANHQLPMSTTQMKELLLTLCSKKDDTFMQKSVPVLNMSVTVKQGIEQIACCLKTLHPDAFPSGLDELRQSLYHTEKVARAGGFFVVAQMCQEMEELTLQHNNGDTFLPESRLLALEQLIAQIKMAFTLEALESSDTFSSESVDEQIRCPFDFYYVESEQKLLESAKKKAVAQGLKIQVESDPEIALRQIRNPLFLPRVLIVNRNYPGTNLSGFDLINAYRDVHGQHAGSFGMIFDTGVVEERVQAMKKGIEIFLEKPFAINKLFDVCRLELSLQEKRGFKVLILDDDESICHFASDSLAEVGIQCKGFAFGTQLFEELENYNPDLLLIDISLPDYNGMDLLKILRSDFRYKDLPVIVVTVASEQHLVEEAYSIGIDDYIVKPLVKRIFQARIVNFTQKVLAQSVVRDHDVLTGLLNRRAFTEQFQIAVWRGLRNQENMAFALIDLDFFKSVNDRYGHAAGDEALVSFSRLLSSAFRKSDLIGRWGGEEFAILFDKGTQVEAEVLLNNLLERFKEEPLLLAHPNFRVTFSCGIAAFPQHGQTIEDLSQAADLALYEAKKQGRNCVVSTSNRHSNTSMTHDSDLL